MGASVRPCVGISAGFERGVSAQISGRHHEHTRQRASADERLEEGDQLQRLAEAGLVRQQPTATAEGAE